VARSPAGLPRRADFPALQCTLPSGAPPACADERFNDLEYCDFEACDWLNNSLSGESDKERASERTREREREGDR